jgi:hypothetical protein
MKIQFGPFLIVLALLSAPLAWPQSGSGGSGSSGSGSSGSGSSGSSQSGSSDSSQDNSSDSSPSPQSPGPKQVFTHPEQKPPLALLDEVTAHSFINLGLALGTSWDSNAAAFAAQGYSQTLLTVGPSIGIQQVHSSVVWQLQYLGGFMYAPSRTYYNSMNHDLTAGVLWQISPHWQVSANDSYLYTADPFQSYLVNAGTPTFNQPNPTIYIPLAVLEQNSASLNLTNELTAHDSLTFTGTENFRNYLHTTYTAYDESTWGGLVAYQHVFSARLIAGTAFSYTTIDIAHGTSRSGIQMYQLYGSYRINPHLVATGWVGPELTNTKNIVPVLCNPYGCFKEIVHQSNWTTAFGGTLAWQGVRNAANLQLAKQVTDGGGLLGVVRLYIANANVLRQLTPLWSGNIGLSYGSNLGISTLYFHRHLDTLNGTVGLSRKLSPNWYASLQYLRFYQRQANIYSAQVPKWTDNRIQFTLQYNWGHSLGR